MAKPYTPLMLFDLAEAKTEDKADAETDRADGNGTGELLPPPADVGAGATVGAARPVAGAVLDATGGRPGVVAERVAAVPVSLAVPSVGDLVAGEAQAGAFVGWLRAADGWLVAARGGFAHCRDLVGDEGRVLLVQDGPPVDCPEAGRFRAWASSGGGPRGVWVGLGSRGSEAEARALLPALGGHWERAVVLPEGERP